MHISYVGFDACDVGRSFGFGASQRYLHIPGRVISMQRFSRWARCVRRSSIVRVDTRQ
jgi:hypothetical protein